MTRRYDFVRMTARTAAAFVVLTLAGRLCAQDLTTASRYGSAVQVYRTGDFAGAARSLKSIPGTDVEHAVTALIARHVDDTARAAAMLHTDMVLRLEVSSPADASTHLRLARQLTESLDGRAPLTTPFQRNWLAFAASFFLWQTKPAQADAYIEAGLRRFPAESQFQRLAGTAEELRAHMLDPTLHDEVEIRGMRVTAARSHLAAAEQHYRQALLLNPADAEVRLRLGRVLFLSNRIGESRQQFEALLGMNPIRPDLSYLNHLFFGALLHYARDLQAAAKEYDAALAIGPRYQSAAIARGFLDDAAGSARWIEGWARTEWQTPDPWNDYQNGHLDREALTWLRTEGLR
jgi:tetratricopeptide (TPR) repeat protein